jgi:hypothetical protein
MNPFSQHDQSMKAYLGMLAEPLLDAEGKPDAATVGNTIFYKSTQVPGGDTYPALVGNFILEQMLRPDGGGFTPSLVAEIIVRTLDLPAGVQFKTGSPIIATAIGGARRECQVLAADQVFTEWRLRVQDINYKA